MRSSTSYFSIFLSDLKQIRALIQTKTSTLWALIALTTVEVILSLPGPFLFAWLIAKATSQLHSTDLLIFGLSLTCLELSAMALRIYRVRKNRSLALETANRLRDQFFTHILHLPYPWYLQHRSGGQASSYLSDIDDIDKAITGGVDRGLRSILMMTFLAISFLFWNPLVATAALITIPITVLLQRKLRKKVRQSSRSRVDSREKMLSTLSEAVTHFQAVKAFVLESFFIQKTKKLSEHYAQISCQLETRQAAMRSSASVMLLGVQYAFFVFGAILVIHDQLSLPNFLGQMVLLGRLVAPMNTLLDYGTELTRCKAALSRVQETLTLKREDHGDKHKQIFTPQSQKTHSPNTQPNIPELSHAQKSNPQEETPYHAPSSKGVSIEAKGLTFSFDDRLPLMEGWDFKILAGQKVAIVGASGCGKTTLLHLLLGLHQGYGGSLLMDGQERKQLSQSSARASMGVVFQEQQLFNRSIRDNLSLGSSDPVSDDELWRFLELAHADAFVKDFPKGLDTVIGMDGIQCSGGQRQRLAIAQTLLRNPPLLLLDEATSALDSFSEAHIQKAMETLMDSRTSLIVAHRLSTIRNVDLILVIHQGKVTESGSHEELLQKNGIYSKLCQAQNSDLLDWEAWSSEDSSHKSEESSR
jgi:ABC-type multidrug transport system fused ATPase/permease subunit